VICTDKLKRLRDKYRD